MKILLMEDEKRRPTRSEVFQQGKSIVAVTLEMQTKELKSMNLIDSPGFNDSEADRSDEELHR